MIRKLNSWRARYFLAALFGALLDCAGLGCWLGAALLGAAFFFELSGEQKLLLEVSAGLYLVFRFYLAFLRSLPSFGLERFSALVESRLPGLRRHLRAALDLSSGQPPAGASPDFIARHLEITAALLGEERFPRTLSFGAAAGKKRMVTLAAGLCAAGFFAWAAPEAVFGLLHPFYSAPLENIMEIRPGNAGLPRGGACRIEATFRNGGRPAAFPGLGSRSVNPAAGGRGGPELFLKAPGGVWAGVFMPAAGRGRFVYEVEELGGDLSYRLRYKGLRSAAYSLKALDFPSLKDPVFSVSPPAYTGAPKAELPYLPSETEVLKGSLVAISGTSSGKTASAALVLAGSGLKLPFSFSAGRLTACFAVFEDTGYSLELRAENGLSSPPRAHLIKTREDEPPRITVLSPAFPLLEAAPQEEINAVFEAGDDIGLAEIRLERKVLLNGRADAALSFSKSVRSFAGPDARRFSGETALELYDLPDGAGAEFYLLACDRFPGRACEKSGPVNVRVADFEARHAAVYAGFEALRKAAGGLKEREDLLAERLEISTGAFSEAELGRLAAGWKDLASDAGRLEQALSADPYAADGALDRYGLVKREFSHGARTALEKALPDTRAGRGAEALKAHEALSGTLGAGMAELEAMLRSEDARSSAFGFESMARNAGDMAEALAGGGPEGEGDWKKLERTLSKIASELAHINELLKDRPPRSNDGKIFALPAESALGTAGELSRAIAQRDSARAAELAAELAETLSRMRRVMEEYAEHQAEQGLAGLDSSGVGELAAEWKAVQEAQSAEAAANQAEEERLFPKTEKARAAAFGELRSLQGKVAAGLAAEKAEHPGAHAAALQAEALLKAGELEGAGRLMEKAVFELKKSTAPGLPPAELGARTSALLSDEERALKLAAKLGSDAAFLEPADLEFFGPAAKRQEEIEALSGSLSARIGEGGYPGELADKLREKLEKARDHMRRASGTLAAKELRRAVPSQLKALEELELGGEDLDEMQRALGKARASGKAQAPGAGKGRPAGTFVRSADGQSTAPVKLPKPGDYAPPEDLRRKVMESLRERYPASSRELIEDYFKGITK